MDIDETMRIWRVVVNHARLYSRGRLHIDECDSEAGLAVTLALKKWKPGPASLTTYAKMLVERRLYCVARRQMKYTHKSAEWWGELLGRSDCGELKVERLNPRALAAAGISWRRIRFAVGCTERQARRYVKEAANAREKA